MTAANVAGVSLRLKHFPLEAPMNKNQKNTATDNPKFMILEAAPERYIKKTSPTLVALIRAVEGCLAAFLAVRAVGFVLGEFGNWFSGGSISLDRFLRALLPEIPMGTPKSLPLSLEALAETENLDSFLTLSLDGFEGTSTIDSALSTAFVLCILVILITTVVDAVALLLLRFAMRGAAVAKTTQRVLYLTTFLLLPVVIGLLVRFCYNYYTGGILNNLMAGHFPLPILILIYCVPLLIVLTMLAGLLR
jgi:ABC-type sugar transport system permease subunit